jgi:uncharacterized FlaG/YvyC family protein
MERGPIEAISGRDQRQDIVVVESRAPEVTAQNSEMVQAVRAVNATELFGGESELTYVLDRRTQMALVRIVDKNTGEVVRQFPPEYLLALSEELKQLMQNDDTADVRFGIP